jgi:hypothetical protein
LDELRRSRTGFRVFLMFSVILAIAAYAVPRIIAERTGWYVAAMYSLWGGGIWLMMLATGIGIYRKHGLWALIGAPFVLIYPLYLLIVLAGWGPPSPL